MRLLKLPAEVQELVESGELSGGHARTLLAFPEDQRVAWARRVVETGLSVRDLERAAGEARRQTGSTGVRKRPAAARDPNIVTAEEQLSLRLGARVEIRSRRRGGAIVIHCSDHGELMRVYDLLVKEGG
jgi:ParB family chromosome partitioning protein